MDYCLRIISLVITSSSWSNHRSFTAATAPEAMAYLGDRQHPGRTARLLKIMLDSLQPISYSRFQASVSRNTADATAMQWLATRSGFKVTPLFPGEDSVEVAYPGKPYGTYSIDRFTIGPFDQHELPDLTRDRSGSPLIDGQKVEERDAEILLAARYWATVDTRSLWPLWVPDTTLSKQLKPRPSAILDNIDIDDLSTGLLTTAHIPGSVTDECKQAISLRLATLLGYERHDTTAVTWTESADVGYVLQLGGVNPLLGGTERAEAFPKPPTQQIDSPKRTMGVDD